MHSEMLHDRYGSYFSYVCSCPEIGFSGITNLAFSGITNLAISKETKATHDYCIYIYSPIELRVSGITSFSDPYVRIHPSSGRAARGDVWRIFEGCAGVHCATTKVANLLCSA